MESMDGAAAINHKRIGFPIKIQTNEIETLLSLLVPKDPIKQECS